MNIVIEIISRSRRVIERHRFDKAGIKIGRAFDNDLIIADPHMSEHHAVISETETGTWQFQDLNSMNGSFLRRHQRIHGSTTFQSGDEFTLGKTHIRIYDRHHVVPAALSLNPVEKIIQPLNNSANALLVIAAALLVFSVDSYLSLYVDFEFRHVFTDVLGLSILGIGWAAIWALVGRLMRHDARFFIQLVIIMFFLAVEILFSNLLDMMSFNSSGSNFPLVLGLLGHLLLFTCLLWLNLYIAISQSDQKRLFISFGMSASAVSMVMIYYVLNMPEFSPVPEYNYYLKPPSLHWFGQVTTDQYLQESDEIFNRVQLLLED